MPINFGLLQPIGQPQQNQQGQRQGQQQGFGAQPVNQGVVAQLPASGGGDDGGGGFEELLGGLSSIVGAATGGGGGGARPSGESTPQARPAMNTMSNRQGATTPNTNMTQNHQVLQGQMNPLASGAQNSTILGLHNPFGSNTQSTLRNNTQGLSGANVQNDLIKSNQDLNSLYQRPAFQTALQAQQQAQKNGITKSPVMTVVDYSLPSNQPRMWVVDTAQNKVLMNTYVAHGSGSGKGLIPDQFSNQDGSHMSSLGTFKTGDIYQGKHGESMHVQGLDKGINDNAFNRAIVVHGGNYIGPDKSGTSWGCFAVPDDVAPKLIGLTQGGTIVHAYAPDKQTLGNFSQTLPGEGPKNLNNALANTKMGPVTNMTNKQQTGGYDLQSVVTSAQNTFPDNPNMAKLAAAQGVLESGLLTKPSGLALKNNLFGIKGSGTAGSVKMPTTEYMNGKKMKVDADFAANNSLDDSFNQYKNLMAKPRYQKVGESQSFEEAAHAVREAGYATDPKYTQLLIDTYNKHLAKYFDGGQAQTPIVDQGVADKYNSTLIQQNNPYNNAMNSVAHNQSVQNPYMKTTLNDTQPLIPGYMRLPSQQPKPQQDPKSMSTNDLHNYLDELINEKLGMLA